MKTGVNWISAFCSTSDSGCYGLQWARTGHQQSVIGDVKIDIKNLMRKFVLLVSIAILLGCGAREVELPTTGRAYIETGTPQASKLFPAAGILVIAERINVCRGAKWSLGESSTTGIDSYALTSQADGTFHLPPMKYSNVCSYVTIASTVFAQGMVSKPATVLKSSIGSQKYAELSDSDVVLLPASNGVARVNELANAIHFATGSYSITDDVRRVVYSATAKEICKLASAYPSQADALLKSLESLIPNACNAVR